MKILHLLTVIFSPIGILVLSFVENSRCETESHHREVTNSVPPWEDVVQQYQHHRLSLSKSHSRLGSSKCIAKDFRYGQWIHGSHQHCGLAASYKNSLRLGPFGDLYPRSDQFHLYPSPHPSADWCWKPNDCQPEPFSVFDFCEKLQNRSILVVGDSLNHEFYVALASQLETPIEHIQAQRDFPSVEGGKGLICQQTHPGSRSRLGFLRNDHITVVNHGSFLLQPWNLPSHRILGVRDWKVIAVSHFEILVINKGAHQEIPWEDHVFLTNTTGQFLRDFLTYADVDDKKHKERTLEMFQLRNSSDISQKYRRRVYFRTATQGTPRASVFRAINQTKLVRGSGISPSFFPENTMNLTEKEKHMYFEGYHWHNIPVSNYFLEQSWRKILPPSPFFDIIHAEEMSSLRGDSHRCQIGDFHDLPKEEFLRFETLSKQNASGDNNHHHFPVFIEAKVLVEKGILHEQCDELHHFIPSDIDNQIYILHNLLD